MSICIFYSKYSSLVSDGPSGSKNLVEKVLWFKITTGTNSEPDCCRRSRVISLLLHNDISETVPWRTSIGRTVQAFRR